MIKGVNCPSCNDEIPVHIILKGPAMESEYVEVGCTGTVEGGPYPKIEIDLALDYVKILDNLDHIRDMAAKQKAFESYLKGERKNLCP